VTFALPELPGLVITGLTYDSRDVKKGDLFFAVKGVHADGHDFLGPVRGHGAVAAVVERKGNDPLPQMVVPSVLTAMSKISSRFFDEPSKKIPVIGITGTNGKTTTTYLIEDLLASAGKTCGVMGTVNYRIKNDLRPAPNTTPMSLDVQRFLAELVQKKIDVGVMEVSSHALELSRVDDVHYAIGVFTNLTQDHLDFHKTMEAYFNAKAKLFRHRKETKPVVNVDDPYGEQLAAEFPEAIKFGTSAKASLWAENPTTNLSGIHFTLHFPSGKKAAISNNLIGLHNVSNCLSAAGALLAYGLPEEKIIAGLNKNHAVPGRLERVDAGQDFVVVVDYAHTHDALEQVLNALRAAGPKRLHCVFGAGGDRDKTKRPRMGKVAVQLADRVVVTSDNPRSEDPKMIMNDIVAGIRETGKNNYDLCEDREEAIRKALSDAKSGDIVLIAGKGHETVQIYKDRRVHFSDVETATKILKAGRN
jgi:UDP-N-acetylmuramoyl-L-alanyl-D-glutamate--2,6-diaminopimelate ligase